MIRAIVHSRYSKLDINGNCYWYSTVTNTENGESVSFHTHGDSNTRAILRELGFDWGEMRCTEECLPIRRWQKCANCACKDVYEHDARDLLKKLFNL
jgi:hypothetical protein